MDGEVLAIEDATCAICQRVYLDPITPPCNHSFCRRCLQKSWNVNKHECPLCRTILDGWVLSIQPRNDALAEAVISQFPDDFKDRKREEREEMRLEGMMVKKRIIYGNGHELVSSRTDSNVHKWTFILDSVDQNEDLSTFVKKVVVHLHPTFTPSVIVLQQPPFSFSRLGWGVFMLRIEVHFHEFLEKPAEQLHHMLSFRSQGSFSTFEVKIDKRKLPGYVQEIDDNDDDDNDNNNDDNNEENNDVNMSENVVE